VLSYPADGFLEKQYRETRRALAMPHTAEMWPEWKAALTAALADALGMNALPVPRPALRVAALEEKECGDYVRRRVLLSESGMYAMPCYVIVPRVKVPRSPAVIALHGHGYGSRAAVGLYPDGNEKPADEPDYHKLFPIELAKRGFVVIVPELLGFGDRRLSELQDAPETENACQKIGTSLLLLGQTLAAWRVYDVMRVLDYLGRLDEVDAARIGAMGVSGGGMICALAAIFDERIRRAVVSCYANVFKESIMSVRHCIDNYIPGILRYAELPDILALIAPKPLFLEAALHDPLFPAAASRAAYAQLREGYALLGAAENIGIDLFDGGHGVSGARSYDWLYDWLAVHAAPEAAR
jgi:dienelactone hydrolase